MSRQSRGQRRQNAILDAALACFTEHGVAGTSVQMIRDRAGASVGSIYHHFGNKEQIAATLYLQGLRDYSEGLIDDLAANPAAEAGIRLMVTSYIDWVLAHPQWAGFLFNARSEVVKGNTAAQLREETRGRFNALRDWLTPHIKAGIIRSLPMEVFHSLIIGPTQDYVRHWLAGRIATSPLEQRELLAQAAWISVRATSNGSG